jgi:hypothetical protein
MATGVTYSKDKEDINYYEDTQYYDDGAGRGIIKDISS